MWLRTANNVDLNLNSPSQFVAINNSNASVDSIEARTSETIGTPLSFTISQSAGVETEIPLQLPLMEVFCLLIR